MRRSRQRRYSRRNLPGACRTRTGRIGMGFGMGAGLTTFGVSLTGFAASLTGFTGLTALRAALGAGRLTEFRALAGAGRGARTAFAGFRFWFVALPNSDLLEPPPPLSGRRPGPRGPRSIEVTSTPTSRISHRSPGSPRTRVTGPAATSDEALPADCRDWLAWLRVECGVQP